MGLWADAHDAGLRYSGGFGIPSEDIVDGTRGAINYEVEIGGETKHALDFR